MNRRGFLGSLAALASSVLVGFKKSLNVEPAKVLVCVADINGLVWMPIKFENLERDDVVKFLQPDGTYGKESCITKGPHFDPRIGKECVSYDYLKKGQERWSIRITKQTLERWKREEYTYGRNVWRQYKEVDGHYILKAEA